MKNMKYKIGYLLMLNILHIFDPFLASYEQ